GQPITPILKLGDQSRFYKFSPDSRRLLTVGAQFNPGTRQVVSSTAQVWDTSTGKEMTPHPIPYPLDRLDGLVGPVISSDGGRFLFFRKDLVTQVSNVIVFEVSTGTEMTLLLQHKAPFLLSAEFSPDGRRVVTANQEDGAARVWDDRKALTGIL